MKPTTRRPYRVALAAMVAGLLLLGSGGCVDNSSSSAPVVTARQAGIVVADLAQFRGHHT